MRLFSVSVILFVVIFLCAAVDCDENVKNENVEKLKEISKTETETSGTVKKTKRGILHHGYGHGYSYSLPPVYYHRSVYSKFPGLHKSFGSPVTYALSHGGASVHSYNVNYPKYNFVNTKPLYHVHTAARPIIPARPIVPVTFNRVPVVVQKPVVFSRPATIPIAPAAVPQAPHFHPIYTQFNIPPATFVPNGIAPSVIPEFNLVNVQSTDGWRPLIPNLQPIAPASVPFAHSHIPFPVAPAAFPTQPLPLAPQAPAAIPTPSITLLPPLHSHITGSATPAGGGHTHIQPSFEHPRSPNNYYLTPTDTANLEQINQSHQAAIEHEHLAHAQGLQFE